MTTTVIQFEVLSGRCVLWWLISPIRAQPSFPQVWNVCSEPRVEVLPALAFQAARFFSTSSSHLASARWTPLVIPARQAERFLTSISHALSVTYAKVFDRQFQAVLISLFLTDWWLTAIIDIALIYLSKWRSKFPKSEQTCQQTTLCNEIVT